MNAEASINIPLHVLSQYSTNFLANRNFQVIHEDTYYLDLTNSKGYRYRISKEILDINKISYSSGHFELSKDLYKGFFEKQFHTEKTLIMHRLEQVLAINPKKVFEADWILEDTMNPLRYIHFPLLTSGKMSGMLYSLGDLLSFWNSSDDFHFINKSSGDELSLVQVAMGLSFTKIKVYNRTKNSIETSQDSIRNYEPEFNPSKALYGFRSIQNYDLRKLDLGYKLLEEFLEKTSFDSI
jgi:hypothetical protein